MLTQNVLENAIDTMHPLEAIEVERRISANMAMIQNALIMTKQMDFHQSFLTALFDASVESIEGSLSALPGPQQDFLRGVGGGEFTLVKAAGFGEKNDRAEVSLSWTFEDENSRSYLLRIDFCKEIEDGTYYYCINDIYTLIDGQLSELEDDAGVHFIELAHELGMYDSVMDSARCFDSKRRLPVFGDWQMELSPTKSESIAAAKNSIKGGPSTKVIGILDAYSARHGEPMDHDAHEFLNCAAIRCPAPVIERMVADGATVDFIDKKGLSPMYHALRHSNVPAIEALLSVGANVNDALHLFRTTKNTTDKKSPEILAILEKSMLTASDKKRRPAASFGL